MKLVVLSPETYEPREHAVMAELFAAGLERYHLRKPSWDEQALRNFIRVVPAQWRSRVVVHQHHKLAEELGCGGVHWKDSEDKARPPGVPRSSDGSEVRPFLCASRSCHTLESLGLALGIFNSVFFSPIFPSISKVGYVPNADLGGVSALLSRRTEHQRTTKVIGLGGITPENCMQAIELGFDGVAVLGSLWQAISPIKVFDQLQQSLSSYAT